MAETVTTLSIKVTTDATGAIIGLSSVDAAAKSSAASMASLTMGAGIVVGAFAALGFATVKAVGAAADFQTQLTQLITGAGLASDQLGAVRSGILSLAESTGTSTDQLTAGMYMISSASSAIGDQAKTAGDKLAILQAAAEGAKVGAADLGTVANATTTLMSDFKDSNVSATQAVNALIATVSQGKTHMEDLAGALSTIAPTADNAHISMTDMLGAMATMTGQGVDAANASTYLRQMIISLNAPAAAAQTAFSELGLSSENVAAMMQINMPKAIGMITDALNNKFPAAAAVAQQEIKKVNAGTETMDQAMQNIANAGGAQYVGMLKDISGGVRQMQGLLDLSGPNLTTFQHDADAVAASAKASGDAITGWSTVQGTFNQQMDKVGASIGVLAITIGSQLLPPLTKVAGVIAPLIANFASWLAALLANKQAMQFIGPVLIVLAGTLIPLLVTALVVLAAAAWAAVSPILIMAAPFIAIGAAIGALVAIFIVLYNNVDWFRNLVQLLVSGALTSFHDTIMVAGAILGWLGDRFGGVSGTVTSFREAWQIDMNLAGAALGLLVTVFQGFGTGVAAVWDGVTSTVKGSINAIIGLIDGFIRGIDNIHINIPSIGGVGGGSIGFNIKQLPYLAEGGMVMSGGLAIVGEQGPEVVSLPSGASVLPNPQSSALLGGGANGTTQTIIIQLDGKTIGQAAAKNMPAVIRAGTGTRRF